MPRVKTRISALIHVMNDERTLTRLLESLRIADQIVVVDHGSTDSSPKIARQYGARLVQGVAGVDRGAYAIDCDHDWILCIRPGEIVAESLEATLLEWKQEPHLDDRGLGVGQGKKGESGWESPPAELRLVNRRKINWQGDFPSLNDNANVLNGDLLRPR